MAELRLRGVVASAGFACGPGVVLSAPLVDAGRIARQTPPAGARELQSAIETTRLGLADLLRNADPLSAPIIEFQLMLLEDDAILGPVFDSIRQGTGAACAWSVTLDEEIQSLESDDEYFRARAVDIRDVKQRVLDRMGGVGDAVKPPNGAIVFARDLSASRLLEIDWSGGGGIVLGGGSPLSHSALLARSRGIPMIVAAGPLPAEIRGSVIVDGASGEAVVEPSPETLRLFCLRHCEVAESDADTADDSGTDVKTRDGTTVSVFLNVANMADIASCDPRSYQGIGLVRTEFLFAAHVPDEETQYAAYARLAEWAGDKPVTIRLFDFGDDKPMPGLAEPADGPLGRRGVRLLLALPHLLRTQVRAIARAASRGNVRLLVPMVTAPHEMLAIRKILDDVVAGLAEEGVSARAPALGMMLEVPAATIAIDHFDADFYCLGTNDLVQFVTASSRNLAEVANLADVVHPAMLKLFAIAVAHESASRKPLTLCGDAAADPASLAPLLATGIRSISIPATALPAVRTCIAALDLHGETPLLDPAERSAC